MRICQRVFVGLFVAVAALAAVSCGSDKRAAAPAPIPSVAPPNVPSVPPPGPPPVEVLPDRPAMSAGGGRGVGGPDRPISEPWWNVWAQSEPTELSVSPEAVLRPGTSYTLVVDLSGITLASAGVTSIGASRTLQDILSKTPQRFLELQVLMIPDERFIRQGSEPEVQTIRIDVEKMRTYQRPDDLTRETAREIMKARTATFGRVEFPLKVLDGVGPTSVALSFWVDGVVPVDELSVPLCIQPKTGEAPPCNPAPTHAYSLSGHDSVRLAGDGKNIGVPDGALQLLQLGKDDVVGVFRCNACSPREFKVWRLNRTVKGLQDYLTQTTITDLEAATTEEQIRERGKDLFFALFGSDNRAEVLTARKSFTDFVDKFSPAAGGRTPSLFARILAGRWESFMIPAGILVPPDAKSQEPIGLRFRIETPLQKQDYTPTLTCLSNWIGLAPNPAGFDEASEMRTVGDELAPWLKRLQAAGALTLYDKIAEFQTWVSSSTVAAGTGGLSVLVAAHHDANRLFFTDVGERMESVRVQRELPPPSLVILAACGSGKPGAADFVRQFNAVGASAVIATSTLVDAKMAGDFVSLLFSTASEHPTWRIGEVFLATQKALSLKDDRARVPYGSRVLSFMLLGNGGLQLCVPPVTATPVNPGKKWSPV